MRFIQSPTPALIAAECRSEAAFSGGAPQRLHADFDSGIQTACKDLQIYTNILAIKSSVFFFSLCSLFRAANAPRQGVVTPFPSKHTFFGFFFSLQSVFCCTRVVIRVTTYMWSLEGGLVLTTHLSHLLLSPLGTFYFIDDSDFFFFLSLLGYLNALMAELIL